MNPLQSVVAFWRDCIKSEGALDQAFGINKSSFGLTARTRAILFEGNKDPFIFAERGFEYIVNTDRGHELANRAKLKGDEVYFGYPLLMFYDDRLKKQSVAPLFVIHLEIDEHDGKPILTRAESSPTLGSCAFEKLGLKQEEIVALNTEISAVFDSNRTSKLETVLAIIKRETELSFAEDIDPASLSTATTIKPHAGTTLYNKAVLFASETSVYNLHLLNDLEQLAQRSDLQNTALKYINSTTTNSYSALTPILPFAFDEYQLRAIQHILGSENTVVTGPPGTGKSQFIANLIINLFHQRKKVLFVSHTGEAVRVVNERVNKEFSNLMMQTGKKEIRQDLGRRLNEMVEQYNAQPVDAEASVDMPDLAKNWTDITNETAYVQETNELNKHMESILREQQRLARTNGFIAKVRAYFVQRKLQKLTNRLQARRSTYETLEYVEQLKAQHTELSRSYVRGTYLASIIGNGLYGKLSAYVDSVQNKKFNFGRSEDPSVKYIDAALSSMNVWSCTLKSLAATFPLRPNLFDYVIFDEASQIDLPSAAPALYRAKNVVVVGDENQLNHIAKINPELEQELARKYEITEHDFYPALVSYANASLFNSAKKALAEPEQELKNHYRSNALIANLFSGVFYGGKLKIHEPDAVLPSNMKSGVHWIDIQGTAQKHKAGSRYNPEEAAAVVKLVGRLLPMANKHGLTIGITTPYSRQRKNIAEAVENAFGSDALKNVRILTVHQFQGSEVDMLIFSTVLARKGDGSSDYWYARNKQILNVAISRAKHLLLIVGDLDFALHSKCKLKDIAERCKELSATASTKEPNRPMNVFEKQLLALLKKAKLTNYQIEPQYVVDNRFTLDFALLSEESKVAIELDGRQHEIIGGLTVFEDGQRDRYLRKNGWRVLRVTASELVGNPDGTLARIKDGLVN
jgi:very-short-patch-repair endonuclease/KaiC/GvpD/RAD55 family RecA-like ATPase